MYAIKTKPLSVNNCWKGQRFKTQEYKDYENILFRLLPKVEIPKGKLELTLIFGFSSKASDIDNGVKPFVDILQKAYLFNDKMIYRMNIEKVDVKKGEEYIEFKIEEYKQLL